MIYQVNRRAPIGSQKALFCCQGICQTTPHNYPEFIGKQLRDDGIANVRTPGKESAMASDVITQTQLYYQLVLVTAVSIS